MAGVANPSVPLVAVAVYFVAGTPGALTPRSHEVAPTAAQIDAMVTNRLDLPLTVHGLHSRPGDVKSVLVVAPGQSRPVTFLVGEPSLKAGEEPRGFFKWYKDHWNEKELGPRPVDDPLKLLALDGFEQTVVRFTTDIPYLTNWGLPLLIGPGSILVAHTERERVAKSELFRSVEIYADLVRTLLVREEVTTGAA